MKHLKWIIPVALILAVVVIGAQKKTEEALTDSTLEIGMVVESEITIGEQNKLSIVFTKDESSGIRKVADGTSEDGIPFGIYTYLGNVTVIVDDKEYTLEEALNNNVVTLEDMIAVTKDQCKRYNSYEDGGSDEYHCKDYALVKFNTLDDRRDVYIGPEDMSIYNVE